MKEKKPSMYILRQLCGEVRDDDGIDPREFKKEERKRNNIARDRRLCAQVKRCLDLAVPDALNRSGIELCEVVSVEPTPDVTRLSVVVAVDKEQLERAREVLPRLKGRLREAVAQAVNRKKAPDLALEVTALGEVYDG